MDFCIDKQDISNVYRMFDNKIQKWGRRNRVVGLEALLLNILFIILSILVYQIFCFEKAMKLTGKGRNPLVIGVLGSIVAMLCMLFPFQMIPGYIFDMRAIPLLVAMLYGGRTAGIMVYVTVLAVRYHIGGDGFYATLYMYSVITAAAYWLEKRFVHMTAGRRIGLIIGSAAASSMFITLYCGWQMSWFADLPEQFPVFMAQYCLIQISGVWLCAYIIENTRRNIELKLDKNRSEMMYAMGELAASVAHEIRNPLTAVRGFAQLLHEGRENVQSYRSYTRIMIDELDRAETIIRDYLTFANPNIRHEEPVDIAQHLRHVGDLMSSYALIRHVQMEVDGGLTTTIVMDRGKLTQCMVNLIKNEEGKDKFLFLPKFYETNAAAVRAAVIR